MALINMKMSREEAKEYAPQAIDSEGPEYPYGLCICLNDDSLEKLGITNLPKVGTEMMIMAKVKVTSTRAYSDKEGEAESSVDLQITDMEIQGNQTERNNSAATMLYGG